MEVHSLISVRPNFFLLNRSNLLFQDFPGNPDRNTVVSHVLAIKIRARYVRFVVESWNGFVCMRVEVYECDE